MNTTSGEFGNITAVGLILALCAGVLLLLVPRRYALAPLLAASSYLTLGQSLIVGGAHFHLIRIVIAFGVARLFVRREIFAVELNGIDKVFLAWLIIRTFLFVIGSGEAETFFERLGFLYTSGGIYFFIRAVVRDFDDIIFSVRVLGVILIPLAVPFFIEYTTGRNPFFLLDGVPEFSQIREGRIRCQGPFSHPILAGTFGATAMPLFVGLWGYSARRRFLIVGSIVATTFILIASSSSGPLLAYLISIIGLVCWMFQTHMRAIRWGIGIFLLVSHVIMKAPVWFLIARLSDIVGGGGWYRSALIDAFISHFDEWWLIGTNVTIHWMPTGVTYDPKMADIVNHFVVQGVNGGLLCLVCFVWLVVKCFQATGKAVRDEVRFSDAQRFMIWSVGCAMLGHVVSFFSVSYFDQISVFLYLTIGIVATFMDTMERGASESKWP